MLLSGHPKAGHKQPHTHTIHCVRPTDSVSRKPITTGQNRQPHSYSCWNGKLGKILNFACYMHALRSI